jgi:type I restriction enzyme S subunit
MELKSGYKQTEVGVIPEDWEVASLGDCLTLLTDFEANGSFEHVARNVRVYDVEKFAWYVRATDLENNTPLTGVRYVDQVSYRFLKKTTLVGGEVLITKRGEIGKVYLFQSKTPYATLAPNLYLLKLKKQVVPEYVFAYFKYGNGNRTLKNINASTTLGALYKNDVKAIILPCPQVTEQRAIAGALSDVDSLLAKLDALLTKKRDLKQAAMQQLLTGQTRLPGFKVKHGCKQTEVGVIPEDWQVVALGDIGECLIGLTYKPSNVKDDGTLVLRSSNIQEGVLAFNDNVYVDVEIPERIRIQDGDILVCVRNGSRALIGKCALLDLRVIGHTFGAFMSVFRTPDSAFIFQQFQSDLIKRQINENIGATINQITNANLNSFKIPLPTNGEERNAIATVLSDMDAEIAALESRREKTRALKQGMMQELLTGRIRLV